MIEEGQFSDIEEEHENIKPDGNQVGCEVNKLSDKDVNTTQELIKNDTEALNQQDFVVR